MAIPSKQIGWGTEENLLWQISKQLETLTKVTYNIGGGSTTTTTTTIPVNCIEFVADTTSGGTTFVMYIEVSSSVTYTVDWGDSLSDSGSINSDANIEHTYSAENTAHTVRLCFSDASAVTLLDFWGND
jgi:hypothetical protein